jgi:hypothetical protein
MRQMVKSKFKSQRQQQKKNERTIFLASLQKKTLKRMTLDLQSIGLCLSCFAPMGV